MIQRIQTLWLLLASACAFATLQFSFFSGNKIVNNIKQFTSLTAKENIPLIVLTVAVAIASLVTVFLYKDRKTQLKITIAVLILSIANIVLYFSAMKNYVEGTIDLTSVFAFIIPIFLLLAARGIYKDERLIKSVDRLR
ncbi:MAG: DUF4293 domain-containing protein [Chitinophagaceae bacterium]